jgi:arylsulfatase A-like enzyme
LTPGERWIDVSADLTRWAGKTVSLVFKTRNPEAGSVAFWGSPVIYEPVAEPPCMVLYLVDTFGAKHAGLLGYDRPTTPNISRLAADGVYFSRAFCNSPVTAASVPDTQLSMSTERHGVYAASMMVPEELVTIAEAMRAAGFATALFSTNAYAGPRQNLDQGFDQFVDRVAFVWEGPTDRTVPLEHVESWVKQRADRPTFLYIHTAEPHSPYVPPPEYAGKFDPDYQGSIDGTLSRSGFHFAKDERDIEHVRALYDEEVLYADARFGRFLDLLNDLGVKSRANIFLIADHGEELYEHGNWGHGPSLHTEVMHVPWIAAGPLITARGRVDTPVQLYDVMPTILALFDLPQPYKLAGESLLSLLKADGPPGMDIDARRTIVHSHHRYAGLGVIQYAVIEDGRWKLMYTYDPDKKSADSGPTAFSLYDLQDSFYDKEDVIHQHRDVARRLIETLIAYRAEQHPYERRSAQTELKMDPEQIRQLQELGYIERDDEAGDGGG